NFGGWQGGANGRQKEWNPKDQWLTAGRIAYHAPGLQVGYRLDYLDETIYNLGLMNPNNYRARDQNYLSKRFTHQLQADWTLRSNMNIHLAASYQDYKRRTLTTMLDFTNGSRTLSTGEGDQDLAAFDTKFIRGTLFYKLSTTLSLQP